MKREGARHPLPGLFSLVSPQDRLSYSGSPGGNCVLGVSPPVRPFGLCRRLFGFIPAASSSSRGAGNWPISGAVFDDVPRSVGDRVLFVTLVFYPGNVRRHKPAHSCLRQRRHCVLRLAFGCQLAGKSGSRRGCRSWSIRRRLVPVSLTSSFICSGVTEASLPSSYQ